MTMVSKSWIAFVIITMFFTGCMLWPVSKKDLIGTYQSVLQDGTPGLPDGGSEVLELRSDGACKQKITLKDGKSFSTQGTWEWRTYKWPGDQSYKRLEVKGLYWVVDERENINPNLEKSRETTVPSYPVGRTLTGRIIIGSREGTHYEKQ